MPNPAGNRGPVMGQAGADLIKRYESCAKPVGAGRFAAYPDPGTGNAPWTIGWGATGPDIRPGLVWTQAQCDARLDRDITSHAATVARLIGEAKTTRNQFDALTSFQYNTGKLGQSTLLKKHVAGDYAGATVEFGKWTRAAGAALEGLVKRRTAEATLYATPDQPAAPAQ